MVRHGELDPREMYELARRNDIPILVVAAFRGAAKSLIFTQCYPLYAIMAQGGNEDGTADGGGYKTS